MFSVVFALLTSLVHADTFEARLIVASTHKRLALVSMANAEGLAFGECQLPKDFAPNRDRGVPVEALLNCKQLGETLPNKTEIRFKLENAFKVRLADRIDSGTGASAGSIMRRSLAIGAFTGAGVTAMTAAMLPGSRGLAGLGTIFGVTTGATTLAASIRGTNTAYAENGSAALLAEVKRSAVLTTLAQPLVIEDISEMGLLNHNGFLLAKTTLAEAIETVAIELRIVPGGGSAGGAGASSAW